MSSITKAKQRTSTGIQHLYKELCPTLQRIIGKVDWPSHNELIQIAEAISTGTAMGVSDGSVRTIEDRASQAWIIQAANGSEIKGKGPVDGTTESRTSHRAELQGQADVSYALSHCEIFQSNGRKINVLL